MSISLPNPSARLRRAAAAERTDLDRVRERLTRERDRLVAQLRQVDDALAVVDQRLAILAPLIGMPQAGASDGGVLELATPSTPPTDAPASGPAEDARRVLRGPDIREVAVEVLLAQPGHIEALHYRRWYELLLQAGYAVAGKDPLAVFLTQVSRSPVVRKATKPGVYEVDRHAPLRIRQRLERLQGELREVTVSPQRPVELAAVRARRHELDLAISQQERALDEATRVFRRHDADTVPRLGATTSR
jgi:hypothetical protein